MNIKKWFRHGETVTDEEIDNLCNTMYEYALSQCTNKQEEKTVKRITKKNLLAWGLLQVHEGKVVPINGFMLLTRNDMPEASVQCGVFKGTNRAVFGGLLRRDVYEFPIDCIRELVVNALTYMKIIEQWGKDCWKIVKMQD